MMTRKLLQAAKIFVLYAGWAFAVSASANPYVKVAPSQLPTAMMEGDLQSFKTAISRQINHCRTLSGEQKVDFAGKKVSRKNWCIQTGEEFLKLANSSTDVASVYEKAKTRFQWYKSKGGDDQGEVKFTGYYFPNLKASRVETAEFGVPLYARPDDLVQITENGKRVWRKRDSDGGLSAYPDRRKIEEGKALVGQGLELAWVADPFDAFIFEVQGAGAVTFEENGKTERQILNYSAQNGHKYVSIAKVLKDKGVASEFLTIPGMRRYFRENPTEMMPTLWQNPSYVFFKRDSEGPYGVHVVLSPGHSVAIDSKVFPLGAFTLFKTNRPVMNGDKVAEWKDFTRFAVAQDVGGAILGQARVDIYWGEDAYAETAAGLMHQAGDLYFAVMP